jgi:glutathione S-transferase
MTFFELPNQCVCAQLPCPSDQETAMARVLYTLCGADAARRFSPHSWKIVMALHHKGLDFEERPTPFTAIPKIEGGFSPTVPVLDDNGRLVRDSFDIALYLEETYPDRPSLFAGQGGKAVSRGIEGYTQFVVQAALMRIIVKDIHDVLAPEDQAYFRKSREGRLGRSLEDVTADWETEAAAFSAKLEPMRHVLRVQKFLGGDGPLFADYILFGALQWARITSPKPVLKADDPVRDWFERCLDLHGGLPRDVRPAA